MLLKLCLAVFLLLGCTHALNKYSYEANVNTDIEDDISDNGNVDLNSKDSIRSRQLDLIWNKAKKKLSTDDQEGLFKALKKLDKQFLAIKYEEEHDGKANRKNTVMESLKNLAATYGINSIYESVLGGFESHGANTVGDRHNRNSVSFDDAKLGQMWSSALRSGGFDENELDALRVELEHHQKKLNDYNQLREDSRSTHTKDNSVINEGSDDSNKNAQAEMKRRLKDIQSGYENIRQKVMEKRPSKSINHPKVVQLLEKAKELFSGKELESIEEELLHFQQKIEKLEYLENELNDRKSKKDYAHKDPSDKLYTRDIRERFDEYARKIEKYTRYFNSKFHTEL